MYRSNRSHFPFLGRVPVFKGYLKRKHSISTVVLMLIVNSFLRISSRPIALPDFDEDRGSRTPPDVISTTLASTVQGRLGKEDG